MLYCFQEVSKSYFCVPTKMQLTEYHQSMQSMGIYAHLKMHTQPCTYLCQDLHRHNGLQRLHAHM